MALVQDLITLSLKDSGIVGVGQTPLAEDINDSFTRLNQMISIWARKQFYVWHLNEYVATATNATSYSVGPSGNFTLAGSNGVTTPAIIPAKIDSAFLRQLINAAPNQVDWPLEILMSRDAYNRIALKQLTSFTRYLYYDYSYETGEGTVYPWPLPNSGLYELHICFKEQVTRFTSLTQTVNFPPEYEALITLALAKRNRVAYQMGSDPDLEMLLDEAISAVTGANFEIPTLQVASDLLRNAIWDPYSDQVY
jgi:hypothetical protein